MIGIFDSGIGGLTVVRELLRQAPDASFIYFGDTARVPYGNKSREVITRYALEDVDFLMRHDVTAIVIACNTASTVADEVRAHAGSIPLFDVIAPAVEDALNATKGRIGVIGTRATIGSGVYPQKLKEQQRDLDVSVQPCSLLVPLVEEGWLDDPETKRIVKRYLSPLRVHNVDTLILGCTHYPLLTPIIQRFMGNRTTLIDSASSVVRRVVASGIERSVVPVQRYFLTDISKRSTEVASQWLGRPILFEQAVLTCMIP